MRLRNMNINMNIRSTTIRVVERINLSSVLGRLGRDVGLTIGNNCQNSISTNETGNRASKVGVADTSRLPTSIKDALDRTGIDAGITHYRGATAIYYNWFIFHAIFAFYFVHYVLLKK